MSHLKWIAIEGIVGAGKTTTAELLGDRANRAAVIERSQDHPFLEDYYRDPNRYAIETEIAFMLLQVHQVRDLDPTKDIVTDFAPGKNLVFASTNSSPEDQCFLKEVQNRLWSELPWPDLAVFLDPPADVCVERIAQRGRSYEQGIEVAEMTALRDAYLDGLKTLGERVATLSLNGAETPIEVADAVRGLAEGAQA